MLASISTFGPYLLSTRLYPLFFDQIQSKSETRQLFGKALKRYIYISLITKPDM